MVTISPHKACLMNQTEIASEGCGQCDGLCVDRHGHEACIASLFLVPVQSSACSRNISRVAVSAGHYGGDGEPLVKSG